MQHALAVQNCQKLELGRGPSSPKIHMDLEKAYNRVDRKGLWDVLRIYNVGGCLPRGIKSFNKDMSASVQLNGKLSVSFGVVGVRQDCVTSP